MQLTVRYVAAGSNVCEPWDGCRVVESFSDSRNKNPPRGETKAVLGPGHSLVVRASQPFAFEGWTPLLLSLSLSLSLTHTLSSFATSERTFCLRLSGALDLLWALGKRNNGKPLETVCPVSQANETQSFHVIYRQRQTKGSGCEPVELPRAGMSPPATRFLTFPPPPPACHHLD
jgi:hypothetical protein